jgi:hypothetical protein
LVELLRANRKDGAQDVRFAIVNLLAVKAHRWLNCDQCQQLHEMILKHVAQTPSLFVIADAVLDAQGLSRGNLDVVDVIAVPDTT